MWFNYALSMAGTPENQRSYRKQTKPQKALKTATNAVPGGQCFFSFLYVLVGLFALKNPHLNKVGKTRCFKDKKMNIQNKHHLKIWGTTAVDGRNPRQPPGMKKPPANNGINYLYQLQLFSRIYSNSMNTLNTRLLWVTVPSFCVCFTELYLSSDCRSWK